VVLNILPLAERIGDVRVLAQHFVEEYSERVGLESCMISEEALRLLECYNWPGNVRELESVVAKAVLHCQNGSISMDHIDIERTWLKRSSDSPRKYLSLKCEDGGTVQGGDGFGWIPGQTLNDIERNVILNALGFHHGNRTHTARALGISIRTLRNKLADYRRMGFVL
jgi:DNA-binding NtrC family response regulator